MRTFGITYDTGFTTVGTTTREPFDPAIVRREMHIIRNELGCDAVRVTGGDRDRLEMAARFAADAQLEVRYSPFTNGLTTRELLDFLTDSAERAERLRRGGAEVVFLTGSDISLFTVGMLPGDTFEERAAVLADPQRMRAALPGLPHGPPARRSTGRPRPSPTQPLPTRQPPARPRSHWSSVHLP